jgi:D-aminopeptidase
VWIDLPNGNGEMSGLLQARRLGVLSSPICMTNTSNVGIVYDALLDLQPRDATAGVPAVGETWDAFLNDIEGRHVHASTYARRSTMRNPVPSRKAVSAAARA